MSLFKREKWRLDLAASRASLSRWHPHTSTWEMNRCLSLKDPIGTPEWTAALESLLVSLDGRRIELSAVVDNRLARFLFVTPPANIYRLADLKQVAAIRFKALFGHAPVDWRIEAQWHARDAFLACGIPTPLLNITASSAKRIHVPLRSFKPEILIAIEACAPNMQDQAGWLVCETDTHAMVAHLQRGHVRWMSQWLPQVSTSREAIVACVNREAIKSGCDEASRIYLTGPLIQQWGDTYAGRGEMTALPDNLWRLREAAHHDDANAQH